MKPPPFGYLRPTSLAEATWALARYGTDAQPLAGGQSLVPLLNARQVRPAVLVDLRRVPGLDVLSVTVDEVHLGAMARQATVERDRAVAAALPVLVRALSHVGRHQTRSQGTIGGSLAFADPAAELPAVAVALDATLDIASPAGERATGAAGFFQGPFRTELRPGDVVTGVRIRRAGLGPWGFGEVSRRHGDRALAGLVAVTRDGTWRLVAFGVGGTPIRLVGAEAEIAADASPAGLRRAAEAAAAEVDPPGDVHADAAYRRDALRALMGRVLGGPQG